MVVVMMMVLLWALPPLGRAGASTKKRRQMIDDVEARLWGWDKNKPIKYADVLAQVENKEKFMEETLGQCKSYNVTSPIQINNGSLVREELTYHFHPDDYEGRSLLGITGTTELLKIV